LDKDILLFFKNHPLESIAIIVAIISAFISYTTWRQTFLLSNRPFLWVESFSYINDKNIIIPQMNTVVFKVLNSPAKIITGQIYYYILDENGNEKSLYDQPIKSEIKYPSDKVQYTHVANFNEGIITSLKPKDQLIRYIRIDYKWLSSDRNYIFEGKWEYNTINHTWDTIYQEAT
jgi:hypothetical protein